MIEEPDRFVPEFIGAGAQMVSVHQEACPHLDRSLRLIRDHGALAGVVVNPATPVHTLDNVLDLADFVLVMSVNPGFGGQSFLPYTLGEDPPSSTRFAATRRPGVQNRDRWRSHIGQFATDRSGRL